MGLFTILYCIYCVIIAHSSLINAYFEFDHPWSPHLLFKLRTIICTSNPYACNVQHADMIACHSTPVRKNLTEHKRQLPAKRITLYVQY